MNALMNLYEQMLSAYVPCEKDICRRQYFKRLFEKEGRCVSVVMEYDSGDRTSCNPNDKTRLLRYYAGIYYGVLSENQKNALYEKEIEQIKDLFIADWSIRHQMAVVHHPENLLLPPDDSSTEGIWNFWIRVREEEGIDESILGMNSLSNALKAIGFTEKCE